MKSGLSSFTAKPSPASYGSCSIGHVGAEGAVALLQPQAVERAAAGGDDAVLLAGVQQQVPQPRAVVGGGVELPAEFADVGQPQRGHRHRAEIGRAGRGSTSGAAFEKSVSVSGAITSRALRAPEADAAGLGRGVANLHRCRRPARGAAASPGRGCRSRRPGTDRVPSRATVTSLRMPPSMSSSRQYVTEPTDLSMLPVTSRCKKASDPGPADLEPLERGHVVDGDRLAGDLGLGGDDRRPVPRRPGVRRRHLASGDQPGVGLVPLRALPAVRFEELTAPSSTWRA